MVLTGLILSEAALSAPAPARDDSGGKTGVARDTPGVASVDGALSPDADSSVLPGLAPIGMQHVRVGEDYVLTLRGHLPEGLPEDHPPPDLLLRHYARGMHLAPITDGWYELAWRPEADQTGYHRVLVVVTDARDSWLESHRWIEFEVEAPATPHHAPGFDASAWRGSLLDGEGMSRGMPWRSTPAMTPGMGGFEVASQPMPMNVGGSAEEWQGDESQAIGESAMEAADDSVADLTSVEKADLVPEMTKVSTQIVSTGHVVNFRVSASAADGTPVTLRIDRLPEQASFDKHRLGGREFHWQTSENDQGEFRFLLTAIHSAYPDLQTEQIVRVIVGDPNQKLEIPASMAEPTGVSEALPEATLDRAGDAETDAEWEVISPVRGNES